MTQKNDPGTPRLGFSEALADLKNRQKTSKGAPAYSRLVNRRLGRLLAATAYVLGLTPNQVTAISGLFTYAGIGCIALFEPTIVVSVSVTLLLVIGYALDAADGQLARLRGGGSVAGEWLDHLVDAGKIGLLHGAVLINWFRFDYEAPPTPGSGIGSPVLLVPLAYMVVASVLFFIIILNDQLRRANRGSAEMLLQDSGSSSTLYSLVVVPTDYGLLCLTFALMPWRVGFRWAYSLLMLANALFLFAALIKWFREVKDY